MNKKKLLALAVAVATFVGSVPVMAANFTDINDVPWDGAKTYINSVADDGLMVGDYDLKERLVFRARDGVSYCETMQLVYALVQKATGNSVSSTIQTKWTSVMNSYKIPTWAQPAIAYGLENSIITISDIPGFVDSKGSASVKATRQDVAMMFGRALQSYGTLKTNPSLSYNDGSAVNSVAAPYVDLLTTLKILTGDDLGNFNPKNSINRAEMAVMVSKSFDLMKTGQSRSVTGKVTAILAYSGEISLTVSGVTATGTDSTPVLDTKSMRTLLSSIEEGDTVVMTYSGTTIQSVLINAKASSTTESKEEDETKGNFYSMNERSIKLKIDGTAETFYFTDSDYENVTFYINGKKSKYATIDDKAKSSNIVVLKLDNYDEVMSVDLLSVDTGKYSSMTDSAIKIKIDGSTETFTFKGKKSSNVDFKIDGKNSTYSKFESAAKSTYSVEVLLDDDKKVIELNLLTKVNEVTGKFSSMSKSTFRMKVDGTSESYDYTDDDYDKVIFYIDSKKKTYETFNEKVSDGDKIKVQFDDEGDIKKVWYGDVDDDDDDDDDTVKGTVVSIKAKYITIKKSGSTKEVDYPYKNEDSDDVDFYYNDSSKNYEKIKTAYSKGDFVKLYLNSNDDVIKVYISEGDEDTVKGKLDKVTEDNIKVDGKFRGFDDDIDDATIKIIDGNTTITRGDDFIEAYEDDKEMELTLTINSSSEVTKVEGYVSRVIGELTDVDTSSNYISVKTDNTTVKYYYTSDTDFDVESYDDDEYGLAKILKEEDDVEVELELNKNGKITDIEATY